LHFCSVVLLPSRMCLLCICVYTYTNTYTCKYMYICKCIRAYTYTLMHIHVILSASFKSCRLSALVHVEILHAGCTCNTCKQQRVHVQAHPSCLIDDDVVYVHIYADIYLSTHMCVYVYLLLTHPRHAHTHLDSMAATAGQQSAVAKFL